MRSEHSQFFLDRVFSQVRWVKHGLFGPPYRDLLLDLLAQRKQKNPSYSMRAFARDLKISTTTLFDVLAGKRRLSQKNLQKLRQSIGYSDPSLESENSPHWIWSGLVPSLQEKVRGGEQIFIDNSRESYWDFVFYQKVAATPESAAAIYWDLPGQSSYLDKLGLRTIEIIAGKSSAARKVIAISMVPGPNGQPLEVRSPREYTVAKFGRDRRVTYSVLWHAMDPAKPVYPGMPSLMGDMSFQFFPTQIDGCLMFFRTLGFPLATLLGNVSLKQTLVSYMSSVGKAHAEKMKRGASPQQLSELRRSLR